jgi:hypothetical protein
LADGTRIAMRGATEVPMLSIRRVLSAAVPSLFLACSASSQEPTAASDDAIVEDPGQTGATARVRTRPHFGGVFPGDTSCWDLEDDFEVTYANKTVPWGARLYLHYGAEIGVNCSDCTPTVSYQAWTTAADVEMRASGPWQWRAQVRMQNGGGSQGEWTEALNFALHIVMPDGSDAWDNGGQSAFGYYRADIGSVGAPPGRCPEPGLADVSVTRIYK